MTKRLCFTRFWPLCLAFLLLGCARPTTPSPPPVAPERPFTFAVLGDNRGGWDGWIEPVFHKIVAEIRIARPELVVNTGDMICGRVGEELLRKQWVNYKEAIANIGAPVHHVPGNHDIEDEVSARLWKELWGPTYRVFDHAGCRFILMDTESLGLNLEMMHERIGQAQFRWLADQLTSAGQRPVFVFLHRPLFPSGYYKDACLDAFPAERDRLHKLFVQHRHQIQAVFMGHEHRYHFHQRDGIRYYITGGGGAWPHGEAEEGGFHHYLLVHVSAQGISVDLRKVERPGDTEQEQKRELFETLKQQLRGDAERE